MNSMAQSFIIEDGVPLPEQRRGTRTASAQVLAMRAINIGQSIYFPGVGAGRVTRWICSARDKTDKKFAVRTVEGGARVWRLS